MKTKIFLLVAVPVLAVSLFVGRHSFAQTAGKGEQPGVPEQYSQLVLSLYQRGDTNTANALAHLLSAQFAQREATQVAMTVRVLDSLRSGKTNEALQLLETQLDGGLATFGVSSAEKRDPQYDQILMRAREYRSRYPHTSSSPEIEAMVARAFESLPK